MKRKYIIIANGSDWGYPFVTQGVYGDEEQIRKHLLNLVEKDRLADKDRWDFGTTSAEEIEAQENGELHASGCYHDYHIDYVAIPETGIDFLQLDEDGDETQLRVI